MIPIEKIVSTMQAHINIYSAISGKSIEIQIFMKSGSAFTTGDKI